MVWFGVNFATFVLAYVSSSFQSHEDLQYIHYQKEKKTISAPKHNIKPAKEAVELPEFQGQLHVHAPYASEAVVTQKCTS